MFRRLPGTRLEGKHHRTQGWRRLWGWEGARQPGTHSSPLPASGLRGGPWKPRSGQHPNRWTSTSDRPVGRTFEPKGLGFFRAYESRKGDSRAIWARVCVFHDKPFLCFTPHLASLLLLHSEGDVKCGVKGGERGKGMRICFLFCQQERGLRSFISSQLPWHFPKLKSSLGLICSSQL